MCSDADERKLFRTATKPIYGDATLILLALSTCRSIYISCDILPTSCTSIGSRTLGPQDISAPRHFGTSFKPNHQWSAVLSKLSWVQSVPTFRRSDAEVSRTTFLVQNCLIETALKCLMRVRSVLWPKCPVTLTLLSSTDSSSTLYRRDGQCAGRSEQEALDCCCCVQRQHNDHVIRRNKMRSSTDD